MRTWKARYKLMAESRDRWEAHADDLRGRLAEAEQKRTDAYGEVQRIDTKYQRVVVRLAEAERERDAYRDALTRGYRRGNWRLVHKLAAPAGGRESAESRERPPGEAQ